MKKIIPALFSLIPAISMAGGFQINTQGQVANSMGGASTGVGNDASAVYFNPGSLSLQEKSGIMAAVNFVFPQTSFLSPVNGNVDAQKDNFTPISLYGFYKIKKFTIGLGINNPYGLGANWGDDWEGKYIVQEISLKTFYFQPTVSYKFGEKFGFGTGLVYAIGNAKVRRAVPYNSVNSAYGESELKGSGHGIGFNAGVFVKLGEKATVGLNYRSRILIKITDGDASFSDIPPSLAGEFPASTGFNTKVNLPSTLSVGLGYKFSEKFLLAFDINLTGWSVYDSLNFEFPDHEALNSRSEKNYRNVIAARLGGQYQALKKLKIRAGIAFDQSPVRDGYLSPELPDANKSVITFGAGYDFTDRLTADISYMYENYAERKDTNLETQFTGKYKTNIMVLGIGVNYRF